MRRNQRNGTADWHRFVLRSWSINCVDCVRRRRRRRRQVITEIRPLLQQQQQHVRRTPTNSAASDLTSCVIHHARRIRPTVGSLAAGDYDAPTNDRCHSKMSPL